MPSYIRPDKITILRRWPGAKSPTGENALDIVTTIAIDVPCMEDPLPVASRMGGDTAQSVEGIRFVQTHVVMLAGLTRLQVGDAVAGAVITYQPNDASEPFAYIVSQNRGGAFIDIKVGDAIVDQENIRSEVLAVADYTFARPTRELRIQKGRSW